MTEHLDPSQEAAKKTPEQLSAALARSEAYVRMLERGIPHPFFFLNEELRIEFANEEFARAFGKTVPEITGDHVENVLGPEFYPQHEPYLVRALRGERCEYESTLTTPDGEKLFLRITDQPAFDSEGRICGVFSQSTNVTDLRRLERDARESEARFKMVAQGVPNFLLFVNKDLHVEFCNDHFLKNTNWTYEAALGRHVSEIIGPRYDQRREYYMRALAGETVTCEATGIVGNEKGFFRLHYQPCFDEHGEVRGVFSVATDITQRRNVELALEAKQDELRRSNKDLEQFAYVASHDLKAPLRAMAVLVEWIREDLGDYDAGNLQENLGLLEQRTHRLGKLLDDLLAYSRVGRKVGECGVTDCNEVVRDIIDMLSAPEHLDVSIATSLPTLETYAAPLEQVFRNLIGNALKHHPGPTGSVTITHEDAGDCYVFSVADDGEGIPEEYAERVFQMFQTLKPRDEVEGSGMGLAIVQRIVRWQGGRVWFEPGPNGKGAVFKFSWKKVSQPACAA